MKCIKSSSEREVQGNKYLSKQKSQKKPNLTSETTRKLGNNKDQRGKEEIFKNRKKSKSQFFESINKIKKPSGKAHQEEKKEDSTKQNKK